MPADEGLLRLPSVLTAKSSRVSRGDHAINVEMSRTVGQQGAQEAEHRTLCVVMETPPPFPRPSHTPLAL